MVAPRYLRVGLLRPNSASGDGWDEPSACSCSSHPIPHVSSSKIPIAVCFFFKCIYLFIFLATQVAAETVRQTSRLRWQLPPREQEQTLGKLKAGAFIPEFFRAVLFSFFPHVFLILSRWRGKRHQKAACSLGVVRDLWSLTKMNALCWVVIEYVLWK